MQYVTCLLLGITSIAIYKTGLAISIQVPLYCIAAGMVYCETVYHLSIQRIIYFEQQWKIQLSGKLEMLPAQLQNNSIIAQKWVFIRFITPCDKRSYSLFIWHTMLEVSTFHLLKLSMRLHGQQRNN